MAPEKKSKKRKATSNSGAIDTDSPSKKSKKLTLKPTKTPVETNRKASPGGKSSSGTINGVAPKPSTLDSDSIRPIKPRKRAADFLSDDEDQVIKNDKADTLRGLEKATKKAAKPARKKTKEDPETTPLTSKVEKDVSKDAKVKGNKEFLNKLEKETDCSAAEEDESEDDQTLALIRGFESSGEEDISGDEGFESGQEVPQIPDSKQVKKKMRKLKNTPADEPEKPGTVYIGRIPHGFYEHEMRAYFSQFGEITLLRISRNRTTGRSKHFGFIQFASESVAKIVADTMDNYLMFGHILKCKFIPQDALPPNVWKGANKRFKKVPWNQIEKKSLETPKTRDQWSKKIDKEESKRKAKAKRMKALGYEMDLPKLTSVDEVPVQKTLTEAEKSAVEDKTTEAPRESTGEPSIQEEPKKPKKASKKNKDGSDAGTPKVEAPKPDHAKELDSEQPAKVKKIDTGKGQLGDKEGKKEKKHKPKGPAVVADDAPKLSKANESKAKKNVRGMEIRGKAKKGEPAEKPKRKKTKA
ncbi:nucleolar protein [Emydomyces testavorans]|uniref:Nucleolar protein n=1 Tax=Emydomyces testavorans TaxID=2070801 RepID=A0AAF0DCI2_9EURO|nr:nucleolar protein [Emydomyces testavorans]